MKGIFGFSNALVVLLALLSSACGKEKSDALADIDKVKAACDARDRQKAYDIMIGAAEKNPTFAKSFNNVTANVPDKSVIDACSGIADKVKRHLEEQ